MIKNLTTHFFKKKETDKPSFLYDILKNPNKFFNKDIVYFKEIDSYCVFKYENVKEIMTNRNDIGVSTIALGLNKIYFSRNEQIHKNNKKAVVSNFSFLSSKYDYEENDFFTLLFDLFFENAKNKKEIELQVDLINPVIFINILKDYGVLDEVFPELNPKHSSFTCEKAIETIKSFIQDADNVENRLRDYILNHRTPSKMLQLIQSLQTEEDVDITYYPKFIRSLIFVGIETTSAYTSTLLYYLFTQYRQILNESNENEQQLYNLGNELLRIHPPVSFVYRNLVKDCTLYGTKLKKGSNLILMIAAANMDESVFPQPHEIILDRSNIEKNLTFGAGNYACIGRFASFKTAHNFVRLLYPHRENIELLNPNEKHYFHNGIRKIYLHSRIEIRR